MRIPQSEIDRIKRDVSVEQFLVNPKRQGGFLVACCPLPGHDDKTPSFRLNLAEGWWKCFGCGRGGSDVITFACAYWGLSWPHDFPLALARLGARRGNLGEHRYLPPMLKVAPEPTRPVAGPRLPDRVAIDIYRAAAEVWAANLWRPTNRDALAYVRGRGIPDALIRSEWIGVSTDTLGAELRKRGLSPESAQCLGLLRRDSHETFAGRITFVEWRLVEGNWAPVWATARIYGAGAAWDAERKYLNVRGDRLVVGLDRCRQAHEVVVVEGVVDRLAILSFGDAAVALGSNQPSPGMYAELRALARARRLILLGDPDRAGRKGRLRTLATLDLPAAAEVYVADLPPDVGDPGALAERPDGAAIYQTVKQAARQIDLARFGRLVAACHVSYESRKAARCARTHAGPMAPTRRQSNLKGGENNGRMTTARTWPTLAGLGERTRWRRDGTPNGAPSPLLKEVDS